MPLSPGGCHWGSLFSPADAKCQTSTRGWRQCVIFHGASNSRVNASVDKREPCTSTSYATCVRRVIRKEKRSLILLVTIEKKKESQNYCQYIPRNR
jgi:hypothetical protein